MEGEKEEEGKCGWIIDRGSVGRRERLRVDGKLIEGEKEGRRC